MKKLLVIAVLAAWVGLGGCVETGTKKPGQARLLPQWGGTYEVDPSMEAHPPRTIAVLPFVNEAKSQKGSDVVRRGFYNHFSSLPFQDMEFFQVDRRLAMNGLGDPAAALAADPQKLGQILHVDAVVKGRVKNFDKLWAGIYSQVSVGARVEMWDTKTGTLLWYGEHTIRYHEGGIPTSILGLIATIASTSLNMRQIQLFRACDDLFRDMVKTIPTPTVAEARRPPQIAILVQDTKEEPKKAGDKITFALQGDPNLTAWVDIGDYRTKIPLEEMEPGAYVGTYTVMPGDNVEDALVIGHLADNAGNESTYIDPVGTVTLDTTPPGAPQGLSAIGAEGVIRLKWDKNSELDLTAYTVSMSATPLTGFEEIGKTEFNKYEVSGQPNFEARFFKVFAVDRAGNVSDPGGPVEGMAVTPGPTPVEGAIDTDTTWYAGASPYVLTGPVIVAETATLAIQPGTRVVSEGNPLVVNGSLRAVGTAEELIRFEASGDVAWQGIVFRNTGEKENTLTLCRIAKATVGVTCVSASPSLSACEITENAVGVQATGAFAKPAVTACTLATNGDAGLVVELGAAPAVSGCVIQKNGDAGIRVTYGSPAIRGNTIYKNEGGGVIVDAGDASVTENNLLNNGLFDVMGPLEGTPVEASGNFFGVEDGREVLARIRGRVAVANVLDGPVPGGQPVVLNVLAPPLTGSVTGDAFLLAAGSPFTVSGEVVISNGASLIVQPGVTLAYEPGASINIRGGGISARGAADSPIRFTSAGETPAPGDYATAVKFTDCGRVGSFLSYCVLEYGQTGISVTTGSPEITHCWIRGFSQRGVRCENAATPKILYSTIEENQGSGGIECVARANPKIHYCNIVNNTVGLQALSSIYIDARNNFWGVVPPDESVIWGDNVNLTPFLEAPSPKAYPSPEPEAPAMEGEAPAGTEPAAEVQ